MSITVEVACQPWGVGGVVRQRAAMMGAGGRRVLALEVVTPDKTIGSRRARRSEEEARG